VLRTKAFPFLPLRPENFCSSTGSQAYQEIESASRANRAQRIEESPQLDDPV
jgi:hypothetical protein